MKPSQISWPEGYTWKEDDQFRTLSVKRGDYVAEDLKFPSSNIAANIASYGGLEAFREKIIADIEAAFQRIR